MTVLERLVDCDAIFSSLAKHSFSPTGRQRQMIVRLRKYGFRLWRIAREVGVPEYRVAEVLTAKGMPMFEKYEKPQEAKS
jgi:hypothetical protein